MAELDVWGTVQVDLDKYKEGIAPIKNKGSVFCGCDKCNELLAILKNNEEGDGVRDYSQAIMALQAPANKEKLTYTVTAPGFLTIPGLAKKTDSRFSTVLFGEPGKFSTAKLYKYVRENKERAMLMDDVLRTKFGEEIPESYSAAFSGVIAIGNTDAIWESVRAKVIEIKNSSSEEEYAEEIDFSGVFMLDERYIPFFTVNYNNNNDTLYRITEGFAYEKARGIPGLPTRNKDGSSEYIKELANTVMFNEAGGAYYGGNCFNAFVYDIQTHSLVSSLEILEAIFVGVKDNIDVFKKIVSTDIFELLPTPKEMVKAFRLDAAKNGISSFNIGRIVPAITNLRYWERNWKTGEERTVSKNVPSYDASIYYKGKQLIGRGGTNGGYTHIRYGRDAVRPRLVMSSWCQRVSAWSKNDMQEIDQKYDSWSIIDWLAGPFSERCKLRIKEAPMLFSGNNNKKRTKSALEQLRARLDKKNGD